MPETITGCGNAVEQKADKIFVRGQGWATIRIFEGSESAIQAIATQFTNDFDEVRITHVGGNVVRLEARINNADDGAAEVAQVRWELLANPQSRDILKHEMIDEMDGCEVMRVQDIASGKIPICFPDVENESPKETIDRSKIISGQYPTSTRGKALAAYIIGGAGTYTVFTPWLKKTSVVSDRYTVETSVFNAGKVIPPGNIYSWEQVPEDFRTPLPTVDRTMGSLASGWLKHWPEVIRTSSNKYEINQMWEWGDWQTGLNAPIYEFGVAP